MTENLPEFRFSVHLFQFPPAIIPTENGTVSAVKRKLPFTLLKSNVSFN